MDANSNPAADARTEAAAWCTIVGRNGRAVRTNAYTAYASGSRFVTVLDVDGSTRLHLLSEAWARPASAASAMVSLWLEAGAALVTDDDFDSELSWPMAAGQVRVCPEGGHVRLVLADGSALDGGSAYWTVEEWVEDPELVMGAVLGAAASLAQ